MVRFILTGSLSAVVDFGVLVLLMHLGLQHNVAKAISFVCGTTTAYAINRRWTFRAGPSTRRFVGVLVLYGCTFFVQVGLFALLFPLLQSWGLPLLAVQVTAS
jgi:putative flippase GtrA